MAAKNKIKATNNKHSKPTNQQQPQQRPGESLYRLFLSPLSSLPLFSLQSEREKKEGCRYLH